MKTSVKSCAYAVKLSRYILAGLLFFVFVYGDGDVAAQCPEIFNGFPLLDMSSRAVKLSCDAHKVLIVNFWATWCAPCKVEIPHLNEIYQEFESQGVKVVGISLDSMKPKKLDAIIKSFKIKYPVYMSDANEVLSKLSIIGIPATFVFDSDGKVYRKIVGYHSKEELLVVIKEVLNQHKKRAGR